MIILEGLLIGLLGSVHCVGMCGPIALIVPSKGEHSVAKYKSYLLYNLGRVFTYGLFGTFFGLISESIRFAEVQQIASIVIGIFILMVSIFLFFGKNIKVNAFLVKLLNPIKRKLGSLLQTKRGNEANTFLIGFLNGFLPCGLVYVALSASLLTHSIFDSILLMVSFGIGTIPALMFLMIFKMKLSKLINFKKLVPYALFFTGSLLFVRGMNLGIPYLSPKTERIEISGMQQLGGCCTENQNNCVD